MGQEITNPKKIPKIVPEKSESGLVGNMITTITNLIRNNTAEQATE